MAIVLDMELAISFCVQIIQVHVQHSLLFAEARLLLHVLRGHKYWA